MSSALVSGSCRNRLLHLIFPPNFQQFSLTFTSQKGWTTGWNIVDQGKMSDNIQRLGVGLQQQHQFSRIQTRKISKCTCVIVVHFHTMVYLNEIDFPATLAGWFGFKIAWLYFKDISPFVMNIMIFLLQGNFINARAGWYGQNEIKMCFQSNALILILQQYGRDGIYCSAVLHTIFQTYSEHYHFNISSVKMKYLIYEKATNHITVHYLQAYFSLHIFQP